MKPEAFAQASVPFRAFTVMETASPNQNQLRVVSVVGLIKKFVVEVWENRRNNPKCMILNLPSTLNPELLNPRP